MIPAPFAYHRVRSVEEAITLLVEHGDEAKLLAGGQSLIPLLKLRLAVPEVLIDVGRCDDLAYIREEGDEIAIGAMTRHRDLEHSAVLRSAAPLVAHAARHVGDPQVRSFGTIGGSLAHADPAADLPAVLLALDGAVIATGPGGSRRIPSDQLFAGYFETTLDPGEVITEVRVPTHDGFGFEKFRRRSQDWAVVGVAAARRRGSATVALMNMGPTPLRASAVEAALSDGASAVEAAALAAEGTSPSQDDLRASPEYRCHLARVLVGRALTALGV